MLVSFAPAGNLPDMPPSTGFTLTARDSRLCARISVPNVESDVIWLSPLVVASPAIGRGTDVGSGCGPSCGPSFKATRSACSLALSRAIPSPAEGSRRDRDRREAMAERRE